MNALVVDRFGRKGAICEVGAEKRINVRVGSLTELGAGDDFLFALRKITLQ